MYISLNISKQYSYQGEKGHHEGDLFLQAFLGGQSLQKNTKSLKIDA